MISRAQEYGGCRYIDGASGGTFVVAPSDRLIVVKGHTLSGSYPVVVLPYAEITASVGNEASYVRRVNQGWFVRIMQFEGTGPTRGFTIQAARSGVNVGTYTGNVMVEATLRGSLSWFGVWSAVESAVA